MAPTPRTRRFGRERADLLYRIVVAFAVIVFKIMRWNLTVHGEEHVPTAGPAVIAANHVGLLDFVFIGFGAHRRGRFVRFMALQEAFHHWLGGPLLRGMGHIPVDREGDAAAALERADSAIAAGEVVGIHPEGKIKREFDTTSGKTGAARLAARTGAPLVPCAIWGTQRLWAHDGHRRLPRRVRVVVRFGRPLDVDETDPEGTTRRLMESIAELRADVVASFSPSGGGRPP